LKTLSGDYPASRSRTNAISGKLMLGDVDGLDKLLAPCSLCRSAIAGRIEASAKSTNLGKFSGFRMAKATGIK
jgi:hypothetical protein